MVLIDSGTVTADGTEQQLSAQAPSVTCMFLLKVSLVNMASGDTTELRAYTKMLASGNAYEQELMDSFTDAQTDKQVQSLGVAVAASTGSKYTLKQTAGTNRTYKWELYQL